MFIPFPWMVENYCSLLYPAPRWNSTLAYSRGVGATIHRGTYPGGGGGTQLFSGRGVRPGFPKCGACELTFASEKGGLWPGNFQIWGLVSWKFPNLGACELKMSKFGGLWAKIWVKIEAVEVKISKFSQKGVLWTDSFAWNGTLRAAGEAWKGGLQGRTSPYPLSRSVPPPRGARRPRWT